MRFNIYIFLSRHDAGMKEKRGRREKEVTEQEAFDFFTATWGEEKEEKGVKKEKKVAKSVEKDASTSRGSEDEEESEDEDEDEDQDGYETANEEEEGGRGEGDKKKLLASQYIGVWIVKAKYNLKSTPFKG